MSAPHPAQFTAGDRVLFSSAHAIEDDHPPLERTGTLLDDPGPMWVRVQYDDQAGPDTALVETLTRLVDQ